MGTSLTEEGVRELRRLADSVLLCFDADAAGQEAALRAAWRSPSAAACGCGSWRSRLARTRPTSWRRGPEAFEAALAAAQPVLGVPDRPRADARGRPRRRRRRLRGVPPDPGRRERAGSNATSRCAWWSSALRLGAGLRGGLVRAGRAPAGRGCPTRRRSSCNPTSAGRRTIACSPLRWSRGSRPTRATRRRSPTGCARASPARPRRARRSRGRRGERAHLHRHYDDSDDGRAAARGDVENFRRSRRITEIDDAIAELKAQHRKNRIHP